MEIEGELQTFGTLNEDERTLETDVNTETEKTDEASRQVWPNQGLLKHSQLMPCGNRTNCKICVNLLQPEFRGP